MFMNNFRKLGIWYLLPIVAGVGVSVVTVLTKIDTTYRPVSGVSPTMSVPADPTIVDPESIQFYPNGKGQPIQGSNVLRVQMPGKARSVAVTLEVIDVESSESPSLRVVLIRNREGKIADQIISLRSDWHGNSPRKALISAVDSAGNQGLFIPVEAGMRFVRYLVLKWDFVTEKFIPLKTGTEVFTIEIDGQVTKTASLINPQVEGDDLLYESHASGSGPEFVRCSRIAEDGYQTIFEGTFNHILKKGVAGDWQLEIREPTAKTTERIHKTNMVKTDVFSKTQIGFDSPDWSCNDWLDKLRSLRKSGIKRQASAKSP